MEFTRIRKAVEKYYTEEAKKTTYFIKNGFCKDWREEEKEKANKDNGINYHASAKIKKAYTDGKITRAEAVQKTTADALKALEKRKAATLSDIERAENADDITTISTVIEWKRNKTWGYNPHATTTTDNGTTTTGTASGCGYDKRTAAWGESLNDNPAIMKILYKAEEKRLSKRDKPSRRDFIGYGSGYGVLPYFEGGVGESSFRRIFENLGFLFSQTVCTNSVDAYTMTKKGAAKK